LSAVVVVPRELLAVGRALLEGTGWTVDEGPAPADARAPADDIESALDAARHGKQALFLPGEAGVRPRKIVALHDGTPSSSPAVEAAGRLAGAPGAHVKVVHVPPDIPASDPGSLAGLRMSDHGGEVWELWRREFARRFCSFPPEVSWDLGVAVGAPVESILEQARAMHADVIVATCGPMDRERPEVLRHVAEGAPCPVLILPRPARSDVAADRAQTDTPERIPER
jgi:nucleotide-binding universal stress UspA family protein